MSNTTITPWATAERRVLGSPRTRVVRLTFAGDPCRAQLQHRGPCMIAQGVSQCRCTSQGSEGGEQLPASQMIACQEKLYIAPSLSCSPGGSSAWCH